MPRQPLSKNKNPNFVTPPVTYSKNRKKDFSWREHGKQTIKIPCLKMKNNQVFIYNSLKMNNNKLPDMGDNTKYR